MWNSKIKLYSVKKHDILLCGTKKKKHFIKIRNVYFVKLSPVYCIIFESLMTTKDTSIGGMQSIQSKTID